MSRDGKNTGRFASTGRISEVRFERAAKKRGLDVTKSSVQEDRFQHIDFWIGLGDDERKWGVDVKGNNLPDMIWCEIKNVQGNHGWLYGGASVIAFDMPEEGGFSIVKRMELVELCEENVEDEFVKRKDDAHFKKYTRRDRDDVITLLKLHDIKELPSYRVWEYETDY